jgi:hypothetical protein
MALLDDKDSGYLTADWNSISFFNLDPSDVSEDDKRNLDLWGWSVHATDQRADWHFYIDSEAE